MKRLGETMDQRDVLHQTYDAYGTSAKLKKYIPIEDFLEVHPEEQQRRIVIHGWLEKKGDTGVALVIVPTCLAHL